MAKKINIVGAKPKKIEVVDQPKRRIEPSDLATALGANPTGEQAPGNLDPIALAELGTQFLNRLRSSGGRPALADTTINCRVPLSAEDVQTLEHMVSHIGASNATSPRPPARRWRCARSCSPTPPTNTSSSICTRTIHRCVSPCPARATGSS